MEIGSNPPPEPGGMKQRPLVWIVSVLVVIAVVMAVSPGDGASESDGSTLRATPTDITPQPALGATTDITPQPAHEATTDIRAQPALGATTVIRAEPAREPSNYTTPVPGPAPPVHTTPDPGFGDDKGSFHEPAIDALAERGFLAGTECGDNRICPRAVITRWVMAVWLIRALERSPSETPARFADVDPDVWWAPYVERLVELRIADGCATGPDRYCPDNPVTRGQMANFLVRAFDLYPGHSAGFTDTAGNAHADSIDALAAAGIATGCATDPARYCPEALVTRGELATLLARALDLVPLPDPRVPAASGTGFIAVSAGELHACAIGADRAITCWGRNERELLKSPRGSFRELSVGALHTCGIRAGGTVECWGVTGEEPEFVPSGRFTAVASGSQHSCGLRTNGTVHCWGVYGRTRLVPPEGRFTSVSAGGNHSPQTSAGRALHRRGLRSLPLLRDTDQRRRDLLGRRARSRDSDLWRRIPRHRRRLLACVRVAHGRNRPVLGSQRERATGCAGRAVHRPDHRRLDVVRAETRRHHRLLGRERVGRARCRSIGREVHLRGQRRPLFVRVESGRFGRLLGRRRCGPVCHSSRAFHHHGHGGGRRVWDRDRR